jgi:hypothetical protein
MFYHRGIPSALRKVLKAQLGTVPNPQHQRNLENELSSFLSSHHPQKENKGVLKLLEEFLCNAPNW